MRKFLVSIIILLGAGLPSIAGGANSAYFVKGYSQRHSLNPAFNSEFSYFALPAIGGANTTASITPGLGTLLQPIGNGNLTTFMNPNIDANKFLSGIKADNPIGADVDMNILSVGINGKAGGRGHFTTVDIRLKAGASVSLPYDFYEFVKAPITNKEYNLSSLSANLRSYAEFAVGHSLNINEYLRVGAKVKGLVELACGDARYDNLTIRLNEDCWQITGTANGSLSVPGLDVPNGQDVDLGDISFEWDMDEILSSLKSHIGFAADLGVVYNLGGLLDGQLSGLTLSASITDLGFINNKSYMKLVSRSDSWTYTGFNDVPISDASASISDQLNNLVEGLKPFAQFATGDNSKPYKTKLNRNIYLGAEYQLIPILSLGALFNSSKQGFVNYSELRMSANLRVCKGINISGSYGVGSLGSNFGFVLAFSTPGFNFFCATDFIPTRFSAGIPVPLDRINNATISTGLSVNIGKRRTIM